MRQIHPLRTLRRAFGDVTAAVHAAEEYRLEGAARRGETQTKDPLTAGIPL